MTDVGALLAMAFDAVVLEQSGDTELTPCNAVPAWFYHYLVETPQAPIDVANASPFLQHFFEEAVDAWRSGKVPLESGIWTEADAGGKQAAFRAQAVTWQSRHFMVVRQLGQEYAERAALLQAARDNLISRELLEEEVFRRTRAIRNREEEIALRLLSAASTRDSETGTHVKRIGLYSAAMATALGWSPHRIADIKVAAPMHDIGKIGVPDRILQKPGQLTAAERKEMQTHAVMGADLLDDSEIPLLRMASEIARCHHERFDGSGYPCGISGEDIPVSARIVAIVDVYDALVHRRVYKEGIEETEVIEMMMAESGHHFDPELLAVFMDNLPAMRRIRDQYPDEARD